VLTLYIRTNYAETPIDSRRYSNPQGYVALHAKVLWYRLGRLTGSEMASLVEEVGDNPDLILVVDGPEIDGMDLCKLADGVDLCKLVPARYLLAGMGGGTSEPS